MEENNIENEAMNVMQSKDNNAGQKQIAGAILIVGILIAGAILLKGTNNEKVRAPVVNNGENTIIQNIRPVSANDHIMGNQNAKIVIVEYSDLECPFCKVFHNTMQRVVNESNDKVAWVYRHYPIPALHSKALQEAEATECAWEQGGNNAFWKYTDRVFEITPSNNGLDINELPKIAEYTGLNVSSFNDCLSSGKFKTKIQADVDDGSKAGVRGTPSSFILVNGKVIDTIPGAQSYDALMQRLSEIK